MTNPSIKIKDINFKDNPSGSSSLYEPCKYFSWSRSLEDTNPTFFTDLCFKSVEHVDPSIRKIAWILEPYVINPASYCYAPANHDKFDLIISHDIQIVEAMNENLNTDKFVYAPFGGTWVKPEDRGENKKTKFVSMIASSKNYALGHKLRHEIAKKCKNIDLYGHAYTPLENKADGLKDYMFHIVVENCIRNGYFTEKLIDAMLTKCVPVVWATVNSRKWLEKWFNTDGMIFFEDVDYLASLTSSYVLDDYSYEFRLKAIEDNYIRAQKYTCAENWIYENLWDRVIGG